MPNKIVNFEHPTLPNRLLVDYRFSDATHTSIKTKNAKTIDAKIFNENFDKNKKS